MPDVFGVEPSWERDGDDYPAASKRHEAKISSWCHRFLKRHAVGALFDNPLKKGGGGGGALPGGYPAMEEEEEELGGSGLAAGAKHEMEEQEEEEGEEV